MIKRTTIIETVVILNIILFLYTGIAKLMDYDVFKEQLAESRILKSFSSPIAILLPIVEFIIVVLLVVPRWRQKGLYSFALLMTAFTIYISVMFIVSPEMPCSCGGIIELLSWKQHLLFNGIFIVLSIWAIILQKKHKKENQQIWIAANKYGMSHG